MTLFFTGVTGRIEVSLPEVKKALGRASLWRRSCQKFRVGHIKFEMPVRCPGGSVSSMVGHMTCSSQDMPKLAVI